MLKLVLILVCLALVSAAAATVAARDLSSIARKERARRQNIHSAGAHSPTFTNADLDVYPNADPTQTPARGPTRSLEPRRDLEKEESFWRSESLRHQREIARLDANIRRLEWRLRERQVKSRAKGRLREDTALSLIEESLESLREERDAAQMDFRERARKAGAFPGWLR